MGYMKANPIYAALIITLVSFTSVHAATAASPPPTPYAPTPYNPGGAANPAGPILTAPPSTVPTPPSDGVTSPADPPASPPSNPSAQSPAVQPGPVPFDPENPSPIRPTPQPGASTGTGTSM
jgi:hypothetical protein